MSSEDKSFSYYKYRKDLGYEIYLRFEDFEFENLFGETLDVMGFDKIERDSIKNQSFNPRKTKVLKIVKASPRVSRQINRANFENEDYGPESLSSMGNYDVYKYKGVGMMIVGANSLFWELGVRSTENQNALRVILTRFLSFAFAPLGVVGFWGVPIEEGFVVMTPKSSNFESVFIDLKKEKLLTYDGIKNLATDIQILRLDSTLRNEMKKMMKEELVSFLSMNTCHLSYSGIGKELSEAIYELVEISDGVVYPEKNFKPRLEAK